MKKNYILLLLSILFVYTTNAQTVLSHSTDNTYSAGGAVACAGNPDDTPGTGDEYTTTNTFSRVYTPSNFGFSDDFEVQGVNFFLSLTDVGGLDPVVEYTVTVSTTTGTFPNGTLTVIASEVYEATAAEDGDLIEVVFDTPAVVTAGTQLIVAVTPAVSPTDFPDNFDARIGVNLDGEDSPSYITATGCSINTPTTFAGIGFGTQMLILDLVGDTYLSVSENSLSTVSIYPNPSNDFININMVNPERIEKVELFDITGKRVLNFTSATKIDISDLNAGIYMLRLQTDTGNVTRKIIKN